MDNGDSPQAASTEPDAEQELETTNVTHEEAHLAPADGHATVVSPSNEEQEADNYSQDVEEFHADESEPPKAEEAEAGEPAEIAPPSTAVTMEQNVITTGAAAVVSSTESTQEHSPAETAETVGQLPQSTDRLDTENSPADTQTDLHSDPNVQQETENNQAGEPSASQPDTAVGLNAEANPAADADGEAPAAETALAGQDSSVPASPKATTTEPSSSCNTDSTDSAGGAVPASKRSSQHSAHEPDRTEPQISTSTEAATSKAVQQTSSQTATAPQDVHEPKPSVAANPADNPAATEATKESGELATCCKTADHHKESQLERLTAPTAMRMLKTLQQTQGNKTEWHIATGVIFKSKKLNSDEMTAMVDRLCVAKHAEDNLPPKPHAVKLVYVDNKETYEPVKEVTKEDNIAYMAELYSRCQETRNKTQQQLAEKYLQPLIKPREKTSVSAKKA